MKKKEGLIILGYLICLIFVLIIRYYYKQGVIDRWPAFCLNTICCIPLIWNLVHDFRQRKKSHQKEN